MGKCLADRVSFSANVSAQDLSDIVSWVNASAPRAYCLQVLYRPPSKIKVELPRHLQAVKRTQGKDRKDFEKHNSRQAEARWQRNQHTKAQMASMGMHMIGTQARAAELRSGAGLNQPSESSSSASDCRGWSVPLPPGIIGSFIGKQGRNINEMQRRLKVNKLSVAEHGGAKCVRIFAASQASLAEAQRAIEDRVEQLLRY